MQAQALQDLFFCTGGKAKPAARSFHLVFAGFCMAHFYLQAMAQHMTLLCPDVRLAEKHRAIWAHKTSSLEVLFLSSPCEVSFANSDLVSILKSAQLCCMTCRWACMTDLLQGSASQKPEEPMLLLLFSTDKAARPLHG